MEHSEEKEHSQEKTHTQAHTHSQVSPPQPLSPHPTPPPSGKLPLNKNFAFALKSSSIGQHIKNKTHELEPTCFSNSCPSPTNVKYKVKKQLIKQSLLPQYPLLLEALSGKSRKTYHLLTKLNTIPYYTINQNTIVCNIIIQTTITQK